MSRLDRAGSLECIAHTFQEFGVGHEETTFEFTEKSARHQAPNQDLNCRQISSERTLAALLR